MYFALIPSITIALSYLPSILPNHSYFLLSPCTHSTPTHFHELSKSLLFPITVN